MASIFDWSVPTLSLTSSLYIGDGLHHDASEYAQTGEMSMNKRCGIGAPCWYRFSSSQVCLLESIDMFRVLHVSSLQHTSTIYSK